MVSFISRLLRIINIIYASHGDVISFQNIKFEIPHKKLLALENSHNFKKGWEHSPKKLFS